MQKIDEEVINELLNILTKKILQHVEEIDEKEIKRKVEEPEATQVHRQK